ncbi:PIG-L deacetylase family protein [Embleya sp. NBC_00896]|uniref:PIG-L deacetylase family protein n=1 Tax=Embleya sp. NBC_00896 TaxID=2975961 RepID=UPI0038704683|nr:PIG-L family deacetylase [Embleya sp. NBC_00896]
MSLPTFRGSRSPGPDPAGETPWTSESDWQRQALPDELPDDWPVLAGGLVVVAAHPEDAVLGVGGLISRAVSVGSRVRVVTVTDGDASHPGSRLPGSVLAARRVRESDRAFATIVGNPGGVAPLEVIRLRIPDRTVADHERDLVDRLLPLVTDFALCAANWRSDGFADHDSTGRAASTACVEAGVGLLEFPLRMWQWARPDDPRVPWSRAIRVDLTEVQRARKERALSCLASQIAPLVPGRDDRVPLPPEKLVYFRRPYEVLFR